MPKLGMDCGREGVWWCKERSTSHWARDEGIQRDACRTELEIIDGEGKGPMGPDVVVEDKRPVCDVCKVCMH